MQAHRARVIRRFSPFRNIAAALILLALALRVIIPSGFMPSSERGFALTICTGMDTQTVWMDKSGRLHKEDPSKGAFIGCPAGWGCQLSNINLFRAFEMEKKGWVLIDPGSQAGLDGSLIKANEREENWFGYYWAPTSIIGKYDMKLVPFGVPFAGAENWDGCIAKAEQDCADPKPSAWTESEVHTVVTDNFKNKADPAMDYFAKRVYPGAVMGSMLVFMEEEQADGVDAAAEFMSRHEDLWMSWVPADVAAKVKASL